MKPAIKVVKRFSKRHGWDRARGWPALDSLRELGLDDVYRSMVAGAQRAAELGERKP